MDYSFIIFGLIILIPIYSLFLDPKISLLKDRKSRMKAVSDWNAKRGITMRPNWWYKMPDGTERMSRTGKEKDMVKCFFSERYYK